MGNIAILVNTSNRATECCLLLQSLRTQTNKDFDVFILEDQSHIPLPNFHFYRCLETRMKLEGNKIFYSQSSHQLGVSKARQKIVDWVKETGKYEYYCRLDDDVIIEPDFLERMIKVINKGYDMASGVTACMYQPTNKRDPKFLNGIVNRIILDDEGNYILNKDDCGMEYIKTNEILPAHHFRSSALYKSEIHNKVNYTPTKLSMHGFREEQIFSYKLLMAGYKIGVDLNAMAWHQITPSGGERPTTNMAPFNQQVLEDFTKEHKEELNKLFPRENIPDSLELSRSDNLISR
jgi:GT2 family glycosyltransferase